MKKWLLIPLAVALLIPATAAAQNTATASHEETHKVAKAMTISGHVSSDGKFLISDKDEIWAVANPDVFAGQGGKQVLAKCQLHPEKNEIHVFFFKPGLQDVKYVTKGDSAFRR